MTRSDLRNAITEWRATRAAAARQTARERYLQSRDARVSAYHARRAARMAEYRARRDARMARYYAARTPRPVNALRIVKIGACVAAILATIRILGV